MTAPTEAELATGTTLAAMRDALRLLAAFRRGDDETAEAIGQTCAPAETTTALLILLGDAVDELEGLGSSPVRRWRYLLNGGN